MATDDEGRSLGAGISLPIWMKTRSRLHDRLDFDQSTFSPPENDDSFLYIRYPKTGVAANLNANENVITVSDNQITTAHIGGGNTSAAISAPALKGSNSVVGGRQLDLSQHIPTCKDYILGIKEPSQTQIVNANGKTKSAGTDDGFKGEAAACGQSLIKVASQMVSGKIVRGGARGGESPATMPSTAFDQFEDEEKEHMRTIGFDPKLRRGSRSLPASPLQSPNSSPKGKRKLVNKYFTGAYDDSKKPSSGSILANILALRDSNLSRSVTSIAEEPGTGGANSSELMAKMQQINLNTNQDSKKNVAPKPKPSHLREMNFWSPTSM